MSKILKAYDRLCDGVVSWAVQYKLTILSGIIAGLIAHMFALTNKLLNADEIASLFDKGALLGSGRWGLVLTCKILPSYSMPWLWGLLSICFIALTAALTVNIFKIKSPLYQVLLAAIMESFPAVTGTLCFMFTAADYFSALVLAILGVKIALSEYRYKWIAAGVLFILMLGIYQSYVLVVSTYFVLYMIKELFEGEKGAKSIFLDGLRYVGLLIVSLIVYFIISRTIIMFTTDYFPEYAFSDYSMPRRVLIAYTSFVGIFFKGYFGFVSNNFSRLLHIISLAVVVICCISFLIREKDIYKKLLFILLIGMLPLSINGIYLIANVNIIYAPVLFSFFSVYLFAVLVLENVDTDKQKLFDALVKTALMLTIIINIVFANKVYLKEKLMYEEAHAFYTGVVTNIQSCEGYDANSRVAIIGSTDNIYRPNEINVEGLSPAPVNHDLVNIYTKEQFIKYYIGFEPEYVSESEMYALMYSQEFQDMPLYPYYGSVRMIGDTVVVKLGNR